MASFGEGVSPTAKAHSESAHVATAAVGERRGRQRPRIRSCVSQQRADQMKMTKMAEMEQVGRAVASLGERNSSTAKAHTELEHTTRLETSHAQSQTPPRNSGGSEKVAGAAKQQHQSRQRTRYRARDGRQHCCSSPKLSRTEKSCTVPAQGPVPAPVAGSQISGYSLLVTRYRGTGPSRPDAQSHAPRQRILWLVGGY